MEFKGWMPPPPFEEIIRCKLRGYLNHPKPQYSCTYYDWINVALQVGLGPGNNSRERTMVLTCHAGLKSGSLVLNFGWTDRDGMGLDFTKFVDEE